MNGTVSMKKWLDPVIDLKRFWAGLRGIAWYIRDWRDYSRMPYAETLAARDAFPCLHDRTSATEFGGHYFYQNVWAFKAIQRTRPPLHVDVGSLASYVGMLTAITRVVFIDIRPLVVQLENLESRKGSILELPFGDYSVQSISCLHVAEHVGLGRYGDALDPGGTRKAAVELTRVLAPAGNLYFSVPLGKQRVCFNAHRIHSPQQILDYFNKLKLIEFAGIDDNGIFREGISPSELENASYACGLFHFSRCL
jgi:SAM-dependent methyltransferase